MGNAGRSGKDAANVRAPAAAAPRRRERQRGGRPFRAGNFDYPTYAYATPPEQRSGEVGRHPIVVIGGGIAGLTAATDFGSRGVPCVLLDDNDTVSHGSRSIGQGKRSLEIWDRLGLGERFLALGRPWWKGNILKADKLLFSFGLSPGGAFKFPPFLTLPQYYIESMLAERCADFPQVELRWRNRVIGIAQSPESVRLDVETPDGIYRIEAGYVVAADGVRSDCRGLLGLPFEGTGFVDNFVIADVKVSESFPPQRMFWFEPRFIDSPISLLHQQPDGIWRVDWQLRPDEVPEEAEKLDNATARLARMFGPEVDFEIQTVNVYTFGARRIPAFRQGRIFFAGDAAHQLSPFGGGRGGNSGVQDIDNLVWKIALAHQGKAPDALLDSYDWERVPVADENILLSRQSAEFITPTYGGSAVLREAVLRLAPEAPFAKSLINTGRLSVAASLRDSPLVTPDVDRWQSRLAPGDAPGDAPVLGADGKPGWLVARLSGEFTLMIYLEREDDLDAETRRVLAALADRDLPVRSLIVVAEGARASGDGVLIDAEGQAAQHYDLSPGACVLYRPDQHIAARWRRFNAELVLGAVQRALAEKVTETVS